ncbi:hypothetical protein V8E53_011457 [Lactarius tabidus]
MLLDDILLGDWDSLVHICRRWRQIIFASPQGLNLKILCTNKTPVRKHLGIWPAFPIVIDYHSYSYDITPDDEDDILAALDSEHLDRVCFVGLSVTDSQLEKIAAVMQEPFPALNCLDIFVKGGNAPVLPDGFLGGSEPRLQRIAFSGVSYPALPTLLLSPSSLVELELWPKSISETGYISPEAMVASFSALPMLEKFTIEFQEATPRPDRTRPPPTSRTVLPALASFQFRGATEYLEDLVARIDSPQLVAITIAYSDPPDDFPVAQLIGFIDSSVGPRSAIFRPSPFIVNLHRDQRRGITRDSETIQWEFTHMKQALSYVSAALSNVVHLELRRGPGFGCVSGGEWRHLLSQFSHVQTLKLCGRLSERMVRTMQDIAEETRVTGGFESLELICLQDQPASSIENFIALRKHSGHLVTVVNTKTEFDQRLESYIT